MSDDWIQIAIVAFAMAIGIGSCAIQISEERKCTAAGGVYLRSVSSHVCVEGKKVETR